MYTTKLTVYFVQIINFSYGSNASATWKDILEPQENEKIKASIEN
jgi:hypothetical protein